MGLGLGVCFFRAQFDTVTQSLICVNLDISQVTVRCRISKARKSYSDVV